MLESVAAPAEAVQALAQAVVLAFQRLEPEVRHGIEQPDRRGAESPDVVGDQFRDLAQQIAVLAAGGAPDQGAVAGVEFLDAVRWSRSPPAPTARAALPR